MSEPTATGSTGDTASTAFGSSTDADGTSSTAPENATIHEDAAIPENAAASPAPRRIDRVLDHAFTADLQTVALTVLRQRRAEASAEESDLSYLRRVLHGRLDIIAAEAARRAGGDQSPLVGRLCEILADAPSSRVASARHLGLAAGDDTAAGEYRTAMEDKLRDLVLPDLATAPEQELQRTAAALSACEREVSDLRRAVQGVADACAAELARRYREGEAAIDDLLVAR